MRSLDVRLRRLERLTLEQDWLYQEGLAALLAYARQYPSQSWDSDPDDEGASSFGLLLQEARRGQAQEASRLLQLPMHQAKIFWYAMAEARTARPVGLRQYVSLLGAMPLDMDHACGTVITPHRVIAVLEAMVREGQLRRTRAVHLEESVLRQVDTHGGWRGDPWNGEDRLSTLPPDVVLFREVGKT
jgi:hypothetical protein